MARGAIPIMAVMGVRISWLILARKSLGLVGIFCLVPRLIKILHRVDHGPTGIIQFIDLVLKGFIYLFAFREGIL